MLVCPLWAEAKKAKAGKAKSAKREPHFEDRQYDGPSPVPHEDEAERRKFLYDFDQDLGGGSLESDEMVNGEAKPISLCRFSIFFAGNYRR